MGRVARRLSRPRPPAARAPFDAGATDSPAWLPPVIDGMPVPLHRPGAGPGPGLHGPVPGQALLSRLLRWGRSLPARWAGLRRGPFLTVDRIPPQDH